MPRRVTTPVIDLRVIDDVFESVGHYHTTAAFPPGESLCSTKLHVLLTGFHLLPGNHLLKLLRAAKSITCTEGGASGLLERLWQYDMPTVQDVFYLQGTTQRKPLTICGRASTLSANPVHTVSGLGLPPIEQLQDFGFEKVILEEIRGHLSPEQTVTPSSPSSGEDVCVGGEGDSAELSEFELTLATMERKGIVEENDVVIVAPAFRRLDRTINKLSKLYKRCQAGSLAYTTILIGEASVCTVLPPGVHAVKPPVRACKTTCGLLPFKPTVVTTKGLKWNLEDTHMAMDGLVSTSNERTAEEIEVRTTEPIVWYSELNEFE